LIGALAAAWVLVPNWPNLQPARSVCIPLLATYVFLLAAALEPLLQNVPAVRTLFILTVTATFVAYLSADFVSLTYAQFATAAAAALVGCWAAAKLSDTRTTHGLGLAYAMIVGGWAFIVCIQPTSGPLTGTLVAPLAPLSLWLFVRGPLERVRGWAAIGVQIALVLAVLALSGALVVMQAAPQ
jgi:hypothetical protein